MSNFEEQIEQYLLETFSKKEGNFGYKPLMHPNHFSKGREAHEQLKNEGLYYIENDEQKSIASVHPKRGVTFVALVPGVAEMWKITVDEQRVTMERVDTNDTAKGIAILGELDLNEVYEMRVEAKIRFHTYDKKMYIEMDIHRNYPDTIYAEIIKLLK